MLERAGLRFEWNITQRDQDRNQVIIQMYFKSDLDVSSDADLDTLEVRVPSDLSIEMPNNQCILKRGTRSVK